jgi:RHH-type proline utilization regulon transcriptional repressor/proline dehydrogenase/delta 1-pyrroline-5-carboxylate dehydrogenase
MPARIVPMIADTIDTAWMHEAVAAADELLASSLAAGRRLARQREQRLRRILTSEAGTRLVFGIADRALRPVDPGVGVAQLAALTASLPRGGGSPVSTADRVLLEAAGTAGRRAPGPVMAAVGARLRYETNDLIWPLSDRQLRLRLARLRAQGRRPNLNLLGEAILGQEEADRRVAAVERLLRRPDVDAVSVKISSVAPSLSLLDEQGTLDRIAGPLRRLYRVAQRSPRRPLVNLDMEEHRDLDLTVAVFRRLLDEPEFAGLEAGLALQAYLPDTHGALAELLEWSQRRFSRHGSRIRVRLVKGANLAMERVDAELHGWPAAPYATKEETDASYLRLLDELLRPDRTEHVSVGVASHNLFDVAAAITLAAERGVSGRVEVEMLAGMAERQAAAVSARTGAMLLYVPVTSRRDFRSAMAYLARRLDENTTPEGFLRHALEMRPGSPAWMEQKRRFERSVADRHGVSTTRRQGQDRTDDPVPPSPEAPFSNEPDTDLSVPANRQWARTAVTGKPPVAPPAAATVADVDEAVERAVRAAARWADTSPAERRRALQTVAQEMRARRADALGAMAHEAGKTFAEGDPEVSEGIDYASWYAHQTAVFDEVAGQAVPLPLGVVAVTPPWNFPYAIPAGGVLATVAAGGAAILKPSPEAPATAASLMAAIDRAGLPDGLVQLVAAPDDDAGRRLVQHPDVGTVILTGAWETARRFQSWRPRLRLLAETSGKNAMVITATADIDQAVADLVRSAFGHAGQKCSAASLAIVDESVHDRSSFLRQLADAVRSLRVGPATDPATEVGPVVGPMTPALERALTRLDDGESWLVAPRLVDAGARLWSPGVRLGVVPGSWAHRTEWFGPVLGVMRAPSLDDAIAWQNAVDYGLTAGLASTDPAEHARWAAAVDAGNLYINRTTTGAIVGRQAFGGWKRSAWGPTAKAGGPNYLTALSRWRDARPASRVEVEDSYRRWWRRCGGVTTDMAGLTSESNQLTYHPLPGVVLRMGPGAGDEQLGRAQLAAGITGTPLRVSSPRDEPADVAVTEAAAGGWRIRVVGDPEPALLAAAAEAGVAVLQAPLLACGRVELPRWLREKITTRSRHRYGNVVY